MYWWNIRDLKRELVTGHGPRQSLRYATALVVLPTALYFLWETLSVVIFSAVELPDVPVSGELKVYMVRDMKITVAIHGCQLVALFAGLRWCFAKNGGADGVAFLERFVALAWSCCVRTVAL